MLRLGCAIMSFMSLEATPRSPLVPEGYSYHPEGYLWFVLPIDSFGELPANVEINGMTLTKKNEFHVTVINARAVARHITGGRPDDMGRVEHELQEMLAEYVRTHPISFVRFNDDLRLARSPDRVSIAGRCEMRGLEGYFEMIRSRYGYLPPAQPSHVSLYTLPGKGAVGIDSTEEMERFKKVEMAEVQRVLNLVK